MFAYIYIFVLVHIVHMLLRSITDLFIFTCPSEAANILGPNMALQQQSQWVYERAVLQAHPRTAFYTPDMSFYFMFIFERLGPDNFNEPMQISWKSHVFRMFLLCWGLAVWPLFWYTCLPAAFIRLVVNATNLPGRMCPRFFDQFRGFGWVRTSACRFRTGWPWRW